MATAEEILRNLIAQGRLSTTGVRDFSLETLSKRTDITGDIDTISKPLPFTGSVVQPIIEILPTYEELLAAELDEAGIVLEPEVLSDNNDPTAELTAAEAAALGISEDDFAELSKSIDENTYKLSKTIVTNQGDKGIGIPAVPELDFPNVLGMVGTGASALTMAAKAALISAITEYVTSYVASQIAPLQMQVQAVAAAVPAGAGSIASIPGKIMSVKAKIDSVKKKVSTVKKKITAIKNAKKDIDKQIIDKKKETLDKVKEKQKQAKNKVKIGVDKEKEKAEDGAAKSRKTVTHRLAQPKSSIIPVNKNVTASGAIARKKVNQAIQASVKGAGIQQTVIGNVDPVTGLESFTTITEAIGPSIEIQNQITAFDGSIQTQSSVMGLAAIPVVASNPDQGVAKQRAVDMYFRNPNSLSLAMTIYITDGGGTRDDFMMEIGL